MIEALVMFRYPKEDKLCKNGDIICVKLPGAPWGTEEKKFYMVVQHEDKELEEKLLKMQEAGHPYPFINNPYQTVELVKEVLDKQGVTRRFGRVSQMSRKYLDMNALPANIKAAAMDKTVTLDTVELKHISIVERVPDAEH